MDDIPKQTHTLNGTGWVCSYCIVLIVNGGTPPEWSEEETNEWLDRIRERNQYIYASPGITCDEDHEWYDEDHFSCEYDPFSWSDCDYCHTKLGGERHAVTFWQVS